jgi:hypothetical protein
MAGTRIARPRATPAPIAAEIHFSGELGVQKRKVVEDLIYGSTWISTRQAIATTKIQEAGIQRLPIVFPEEIKNAKVVVEQDMERVRFVLKDKEIIYGKSGFRVGEREAEPVKMEATK